MIEECRRFDRCAVSSALAVASTVDTDSDAQAVRKIDGRVEWLSRL
jgi:hypothetical protein